MLASVWATWLMFGDIPIRQLGLWVGPCICSDKNTLLISVSQLWYLCLFSFKYVLSCSVMSDSVTTWTIACFSVHGDSPGKNTRVGCHALLQGIFPTQGSNPGLLRHRWILYCLSHQGSHTKIKGSLPSSNISVQMVGSSNASSKAFKSLPLEFYLWELK